MANEVYLLLQNDEMYRPAEKTASYKQRGLSQDESLREITEALSQELVTLEALERASETDPEFKKTVVNFKSLRDWIRQSPFVSLEE